MKILDPTEAQLARPRLRDAFAYWRDKAPQGGLPARADLEPSQIVRLLPYLFLVDVVAGSGRFRYRLVGTRITEWSGGDATGWYMDDPRCGSGGAVLQALHAEVAASGRPLATTGEEALFKGSLLLFDRLLLPLAADGRTVDMILGCADGRLPGD